MKKILSCCPVVDKETRQLIPLNFQFQPGKPVSALNASICWLQESISHVHLISGKKSSQLMGIFDDKDGYLTSIEHAYRLCKQLISAHDLHTFSTDIVQIQVTLIQTPVFELFSQNVRYSWGRNQNWRQYDVVAGDWYEIQHPDQALSSQNVLKPIKQKQLLTNYVVFSSKNPEKRHLSDIQAFQEKWTPPFYKTEPKHQTPQT